MTQISKDEQRVLFEKGVALLHQRNIAHFPLGPLVINGVFHKYMDSETDSAWIGFQLAYAQLEHLSLIKKQSDYLPKE